MDCNRLDVSPANADVLVRSCVIFVHNVLTKVGHVEVRESVVDVARGRSVGRVLESVHQSVHEASGERDQERLG